MTGDSGVGGLGRRPQTWKLRGSAISVRGQVELARTLLAPQVA